MALGFFFLRRNLNNLSLIILLFKEHGNLLIIYFVHTYLAVRDLLSASFSHLDIEIRKQGSKDFILIKCRKKKKCEYRH